MNKALCFFLIGCVILAVLFGFASSYDYTFDTTSPQLDLTECRDINAGLLSMSFARVIKFGGNVTNVLNKVVASVYNLFRRSQRNSKRKMTLPRSKRFTIVRLPT